MTPKEKAEELVDKFTCWNTSEAEREGLKSALHCVDEVINNVNGMLDFESDIEFWQEVKTEIQKL